jgi:hypothetical protein
VHFRGKNNCIICLFVILIGISAVSCKRNKLYNNAQQSASFSIFTLFALNPGISTTPVLSPAPGTFEYDQQVAISCEDPSVVIHYTTVSTMPTLSSPVYAAPIPVTGRGTAMTITAISVIDGVLVDTAAGVYEIAPDILYVSTSGTDATAAGWGSSTQPYLTINFAIGQAVDGDQIRVAAGDYSEGATVLIDKVLTLYGGYNASDWTDRDNINRAVPTYMTQINDAQSAADGNTNDLGINGSIIDGFVIWEGDNTNTGTNGISIQGNATVRNNTINGGLDRSGAPAPLTRDKAGDPRSVPWSMGAYEY